jgi:hypothetical protein
VLGLLAVGVAISVTMITRSQVAGDQLNLLSRGWLLAFRGEWVPFGNETSAGGMTPGGLTSLLVGAPLLVWSDHRAPTVVILVGHLIAYLVLDRMVGRILGREGQGLFAVVYWLSPWRLYHSGFLWNPNYLFLAGALHLGTAYGQRREPRFWLTFAHVLVVGAAFQVHASAVLLLAASCLLYGRGYFRVHWAGACAAALLLALSLLPWLGAIVRDPSLVPSGEGFPGRGLLLVYPLLRGVLFWLRYASLALPRAAFCLDTSGLVGPALVAQAGEYLSPLARLVGAFTVPIALWANWRLWRRARRGFAWTRRFDPQAPDRVWLRGAVRWSFVAALLVFCLSPTSIMSWQLLPLFHVAVLPFVLAGSAVLRRGPSRVRRLAVGVYLAASLALVLLIAAGSPPYRCGGERCGVRNVTPPPLRSDHPLLDDLGIRETCPVVVDEPGGWWPDVLPESGP